MPTAQINRPSCDINFTTLPNVTFNYGQLYPELKPNDVVVLGYLLSKPKNWNINRVAIARAINASLYAVNQSFKKFIKLGFATYQRTQKGFTHWVIQVPEAFAATSIKSPHVDTPPVAEPPVEMPPVLEINKVLESNKETTNTTVVVTIESENPELPLPAQLSETQATVIKREIAKLADTQLQSAVLTLLTFAMTQGIVKSPVAYLIGLIKKAHNGELDISSAVNAQALKKMKESEREEKIHAIVKRNKPRIIADLATKGFVHFKGLGNFTRDDLKPYLL